MKRVKHIRKGGGMKFWNEGQSSMNMAVDTFGGFTRFYPDGGWSFMPAIQTRPRRERVVDKR